MEGPLPETEGLIEYTFDEETFGVTKEMKGVYDRDGGFVIKKLLNKAELDQIFKNIELNKDYQDVAYEIIDKDSKGTRMVLWNHPGNDVFGMLARCEKVAGVCEKLLGGEVYHYHTKLNMKNPKKGHGGFDWHQDYGYWYKNGVLKPDLMSVMIALDPCKKANGCLQVLKGSHRCGRIDHALNKGQHTVDAERLQEVLDAGICKHQYVELEPGDAIFFHCNVLHTSSSNESEKRRWVVIPCYNRADNDPVKDHHHARYTPLAKVPNSSILECRAYTDRSDKWFLTPKEDMTVRGSKLEEKY